MIHHDKLLWIWTIVLLEFYTTVSITSKVFCLFKLSVISYFIKHKLFQYANKIIKITKLYFLKVHLLVKINGFTVTATEENCPIAIITQCFILPLMRWGK